MKFTVNAECQSCNATGLYIGLAERNGSAIVCNKCKGTGCEMIEINYEPFLKRRMKKGVKRVYQYNPGIVIGEGKDYSLKDFGGMDFRDWIAGKSFEVGMENRKYVCPAWWYQNTDYKKKPKWKECIHLGAFSDCKHFKTKGKCWERWDKEFGAIDEKGTGPIR